MSLHTERAKPHLVQLPLRQRRVFAPIVLPRLGLSVEAYASDGVYFIESRERGKVKFRQSFTDGLDFLDRWTEIEGGKFSAKGA